MSAALAYQFEGYASFGAANDNTPLPSAAAIIKMTPVGAATYRYDALGNLREKRFNKHGAIRTVTNNYNSRNRIISSIDTANIGYGFNYDTRGNIRTAGLLNFTYDMSDQPVTMNGRAPNTGTQVDANYLYDNHLNAAPHSGVSENACKHMRVYLPWALLAQGAPPPSNRWRATPRLHGMGQTLARIKNGVFTYLAPAGALSALNHSPRMIYSAIAEPSPKPDHLGSPQLGTGENGNVAFREAYTPYGEALLSPAANDNHSGFTGHIKDKSTGLNYMQARYYDPNIGQFLSIDPVDFLQTGDPRFFNRYAYAFNDPTNLTDPTGRNPLEGVYMYQAEANAYMASGMTRTQAANKIAKGRAIATAAVATAFVPGPEDLVIAGALAAKAGQGIKLSLKAKDGWNDAQKAEAAAKVQKLDGLAKQGDLVKTSPQRSSTSAGSRYRQAGNDVPSGSDVDHVQDLQLGGADSLDNMAPLDSSVNRSLGAQINNQLRDVPSGTRVCGVEISGC